ncbi:hypothetical protein [Romboutsia timonensis]|uniref:hypothetical protein n=1 Tax=Romboutsia timonensis TaxID=1776391 RepID=UPI002A840FB4|nr:hypothetical protein [Romboutsia timonensis]MDY3960948.1 hypothetical protein [Romboutsia timonensis]
MSIQKMITEINRKISALEMVHHIKINGSISKGKDLLAGIYALDECIEIRSIAGNEFSLKQDKFLKYSKIGTNVYRFYNEEINILIRPIGY